jgi:hypothetical protein
MLQTKVIAQEKLREIIKLDKFGLRVIWNFRDVFQAAAVMRTKKNITTSNIVVEADMSPARQACRRCLKPDLGRRWKVAEGSIVGMSSPLLSCLALFVVNLAVQINKLFARPVNATLES